MLFHSFFQQLYRPFKVLLLHKPPCLFRFRVPGYGKGSFLIGLGGAVVYGLSHIVCGVGEFALRILIKVFIEAHARLVVFPLGEKVAAHAEISLRGPLLLPELHHKQPVGFLRASHGGEYLRYAQHCIVIFGV